MMKIDAIARKFGGPTWAGIVAKGIDNWDATDRYEVVTRVLRSRVKPDAQTLIAMVASLDTLLFNHYTERFVSDVLCTDILEWQRCN